MDESHRHNGKHKKPDTKQYSCVMPVIRSLRKDKNCGDSNKTPLGWDSGYHHAHVLYLDLSGGYMAVYIYKSSITFVICALY